MEEFKSIEDSYKEQVAAPMDSATSELISRVAMLDISKDQLLSKQESMQALFGPSSYHEAQLYPQSLEPQYKLAEVVSDENFDQKVLKNPKPVLILFSIPRCSLCTSFKNSAWQLLLKNYTHMFDMYEFVCTGTSHTEDEYGVTSHPHLFIFYKGHEVANHLGYGPVQGYLDFINSVSFN